MNNITIIDKEADYESSMKILKEKDLRPITYQKALSTLSKDEALKSRLKGKWFYLAGKGIIKDGVFTFNEKGKLKYITTSNQNAVISIERKVRVWSGNKPLSLVVRADYGARDYGRRFDLVGGDVPQGVAPVVLGILDKTFSKKVLHKHRFVCECGKVKR